MRFGSTLSPSKNPEHVYLVRVSDSSVCARQRLKNYLIDGRWSWLVAFCFLISYKWPHVHSTIDFVPTKKAVQPYSVEAAFYLSSLIVMYYSESLIWIQLHQDTHNAGGLEPQSHLHGAVWGLRPCGWIQSFQLWDPRLPPGLRWKPVCGSGHLPVPSERDAISHNLVHLKYHPLYPFLITCLYPQEEDMDVEGVEFNVLRAFHHELRVDALAWSPESRLDRIPTIRYWYSCPPQDIMTSWLCMVEDRMVVGSGMQMSLNMFHYAKHFTAWWKINVSESDTVDIIVFRTSSSFRWEVSDLYYTSETKYEILFLSNKKLQNLKTFLCVLTMFSLINWYITSSWSVMLLCFLICNCSGILIKGLFLPFGP